MELGGLGAPAQGQAGPAPGSGQGYGRCANLAADRTRGEPPLTDLTANARLQAYESAAGKGPSIGRACAPAAFGPAAPKTSSPPKPAAMAEAELDLPCRNDPGSTALGQPSSTCAPVSAWLRWFDLTNGCRRKPSFAKTLELPRGTPRAERLHGFLPLLRLPSLLDVTHPAPTAPASSPNTISYARASYQFPCVRRPMPGAHGSSVEDTVDPLGENQASALTAKGFANPGLRTPPAIIKGWWCITSVH